MRGAGSTLLTVLALVASIGGCATNAGPPPLVFDGGTVVTGNANRLMTSQLALQDGRVIALGDSLDVRGTRVDLGGAVVTPAFIDHHIHLLNVGFSLLNAAEQGRLFLDLSDATSLEEIARRIRARSDSTPAGGWILGQGWGQAAWGTQALPNNGILNRAAPDHPVFLARLDGHAGWVNAAALKIAGINAATPDPPGGHIMRAKNGVPTGVLLERANEPVLAHVPQPSDSDVMQAFQLATQAMAARGVVEVYDAGFLAFPGVVALNVDLGHYLALLREADARSPFPIRVNLMIPAPSALADSLVALPPEARVLSPRIRITHIKLFADGTFGSRGAALTHPYADDATTRGVLRMTADEIVTQARRALDAGLGVATHAIGDRAVATVLDAYARLLKEPPDVSPERLRIEHFSYAREQDFQRAVDLGIVLSIQSNFNSTTEESPSFGEMRVGRKNAQRVYAWDRLARMGAKLVDGSDYFAMPGPALLGLQAALTRLNAIGTRGEGPEGRLPAFLLQTRLHPEGGPPGDGTLAVDRPADLVVLSANPLTVPADQLQDVRVLATVRHGEVVYSDGSLRGLPAPEAGAQPAPRLR
jgi:predicted amidohydrolase YtcJ